MITVIYLHHRTENVSKVNSVQVHVFTFQIYFENLSTRLCVFISGVPQSHYPRYKLIIFRFVSVL